MTKNMYYYIGQTWRKIFSDKQGDIKTRMIQWRKNPTIVRLDKPNRLDKARMLGYKDKQGYVVVNIKVGRGGMRKSRPKSGRRQRHMGTTRIKSSMSMGTVSENRVLNKYPNLSLVNSYLLYQDGQHSWYEVILKDTNHSSVN